MLRRSFLSMLSCLPFAKCLTAESKPEIKIGVGRSYPAMPDKFWEAAICRELKVDKYEQHFDEKALEAVSTQYPVGVSVQDMISYFAIDQRCRGLHQLDQTAEEVVRIAFTSTTLVSALSKAFNLLVPQYYNPVDSTWRAISSNNSVMYSGSRTDYRLANTNYEYTAKGPEPRTYAKMFCIEADKLSTASWEDIAEPINRLARGAALKINDVFWTVFCGGRSIDTLFSRENNNVVDANLNREGILAAIKAMMSWEDSDGRPFGITPKYLLVPTPMLTGELHDVVASLNRGITILTSPYLANKTYSPSETNSYLLADPSCVPTIETTFLNGRQMPCIESVEYDEESKSIALRAYHDFGVSLQEKLGGVKIVKPV